MIKCICENCDFWQEMEGKNGGVCKRYPPKPTPMPAQVAGRILQGQRPSPVQFLDVISWPKTKADEWCGEFKNE